MYEAMNIDELDNLVTSKLENEKSNIKEQWCHPTGTLKRYFFIDDLLPVELAHSIYDAFPKHGEKFYKKDSFRERKRTYANLTESSPILSDITTVFQHPKIIDKISNIVNMTELEADSSLYAGGLSMMFNGDFLNPHIDNSHDASRKRYRRLNLLYYVTPDWTLENGGNFELWDAKVTKPNVIISKFNRLVVMETNDKSWHSVSPVTAKNSRCCVSNYYFSEISPNGSQYFHVTSFTGRPEEKWKRAFSIFDNFSRNTIAKTLKVGRGKSLINE